jgi:nucleoside phosphorylase
MILCAGNNELFGSLAHPIGVGPINAAMNLAMLLSRQKPQKLLFIGTAGSYGEFGEFELITSSRAANVEIGAFQKLSYTPLPHQVESSIKGDVSRGTFASTTINSSSYITSDEAQMRLFHESGLGAENMEFFALMSVAKAFGVELIGLFCITNMCDERAHDDFVRNHAKAKELLTACVNEHFREYQI